MLPKVRRGSLPRPFMDLIIEFANTPEFMALTRISRRLADKEEREEMITCSSRTWRVLILNRRTGMATSQTTGKTLRGSISHLCKRPTSALRRKKHRNGGFETADAMRGEFQRMLQFVQFVSPSGFRKSSTENQVPRVRFESIAVGSALALRADPDLFQRAPDITPLLESRPFKDATKTDAAKVKKKLLGRIRKAKNWLMES